MKRLLFMIAAALLLIVSFPGTVLASAETDSPAPAADEAVFSCVRNNGDSFHSFRSADGTAVLFLPADFDLADLTVRCLAPEKTVSASGCTANSGSGTIRGDFRGKAVTVSFADGSSVLLVAESSTLPSLAITLDGSTLDDVHADKDSRHTVAFSTLYDPKNEDNDLAVHGGEFKGRGNSSWVYYDKKGYQIRFETETSLLGMEPARKWVLLAGASDATLMRTKLALDAAAAFPMLFTPQAEYADLWINGDYRGLYLITEKPEIGKGRLDLTSGHGVLAEFDNAFYSGESDWFTDDYGQHFALKDAQGADPDADFDEFENKVAEFYRALSAKDWAEVSRVIDPESFASMLLVNEFFSNRESATTSFFWYLDGSEGKLSAGPAWDFDTCMADENNPTDYYVFQNKYYKYLVDFDEFEDILQRQYREYGDALKSAAASQDALRLRISSSAAANFMRYNVLGTTDAKKHVFRDTWEENLAVQRDWLAGRAEHFSVGAFCGKRRTSYLETLISSGNRYADLYLRYPGSTSGVTFRVSAGNLPEDEPITCKAERDEFGRWHARIDLLDFCVDGVFTVEAFSAASSSTPLTTRTFEISYAPAMDYTCYGVNYRPVFNPLYYRTHNEDVAAICGDDPRVLFRHFRLYGMAEGRRGSLLFDPAYYMAENADLRSRYGSSNFPAYYLHYIERGRAEGRAGAAEFAN